MKNGKFNLIAWYHGNRSQFVALLHSIVKNNFYLNIEVTVGTSRPREAVYLIRPFLKYFFIRVVRLNQGDNFLGVVNSAQNTLCQNILISAYNPIFERDFLPAFIDQLHKEIQKPLGRIRTLSGNGGKFLLLDNSIKTIPLSTNEINFISSFVCGASDNKHYLNQRSAQNAKHANFQLNILFVGPWAFSLDTGLKNIDLIYPSLLTALKGCKFHILHGAPKRPEFTNSLLNCYDVTFHSVCDNTIKAWMAKCIEIGKQYNIDIFTNVFYGFYFGYFAAKTANILGKKSVVRFPANEIAVRVLQGVYDDIDGDTRKALDLRQERAAVQLADKVIAVSPIEQQRLKQLSNDRGKVFWCMRGVDLNLYRPEEKRKQRVANNFLFAGRSAKVKGHELIEGAAQIIENYDPDIRFYFAGQFEKKVEGNRVYLGYLRHDELRLTYGLMDGLILPSACEGFANVVVEACACGLPCLISQEISNALFQHGKNVLIFKRTANDITEKVLSIKNDQQLFLRLQRKSRELAEKTFDSSYWGEEYRSIVLGERCT